MLARDLWVPVFVHESAITFTSRQNYHLASSLNKIGEDLAPAMMRMALIAMKTHSIQEVEVYGLSH